MNRMHPAHAISGQGPSPTVGAATYSVPQRFGIAALLGMTTLFACLFAALRAMNAPPVFYLFFGSVGSVIGLAQMKMGGMPRTASALAGAILLPVWLVITAVFSDEFGADSPTAILATLPCSVVGGGLLGYLTGAILAGVFLVLDLATDREKRRNMWREGGRGAGLWAPAQEAVGPRATSPFPATPTVERQSAFTAPVVQARELACAVCRCPSRQTLLVAVPPAPYADLDLRPAPPQRSALPLLVQQCPSCGLCAGDLLQPRSGARECVGREDYRQLLGDASYPELARRFLCAGYIDDFAGDLAGAAWRNLQAAWACDDAAMPQAAANCRRRTAALIRRALAAGQPVAGGPAADHALLADVYRRAGDHVQALAACQQAASLLGSFDADLALRRAIDFQCARALVHDSGPHTLAEACGGGAPRNSSY